jgi:hypothetical protein
VSASTSGISSPDEAEIIFLYFIEGLEVEAWKFKKL